MTFSAYTIIIYVNINYYTKFTLKTQIKFLQDLTITNKRFNLSMNRKPTPTDASNYNHTYSQKVHILIRHFIDLSVFH